MSGLLLAGLYAGLNLATAGLFAFDKMRAGARRRRISEATLLFWSVLGWPGAKAAQRRFRHKTRKQPFARLLNAAAVPHAGLVAAAALWF